MIVSKRLALTAIAGVGLSLCVTGVAHAATTLQVGCGGGSYATIQAAVNAASAGDTVTVCAGSYPELVTVSKSLTIDGAQAGVDARTGRANAAAESSLTLVSGAQQGGFHVTGSATDVTIDGFTISNLGASDTGIFQESGRSLTVLNTVLDGDERGVYTSANGLGSLTFRQNRITNSLGANEGGLFFSGSAKNTTIANNVFSNGVDVNFSPDAGTTSGLPRTTGISITGNTFHDDGNALILNHSDGVTFAGNTITNHSGSSILAGGDDQGLAVTGNTVAGNGNGGSVVRVSDAFGDGNSSGITVSGNQFMGNIAGIRTSGAAYTGTLTAHDNRIVGTSSAGVDDQDGTVINASDNWWGCNAGPAGPAVSGTGQNATGCDVVQGAGAVAAPWLTLTLSNAPGSASTSTLTASLRTDSTGADTSATGYLADGTPVAFAATPGTVSPSSATTVNGLASSTLTYTSTGQSQASTTVDNQTVTLPVSAAAPAAALPEAPFAALLPLVGAGLGWALVRRRRRVSA